MLGRLRLITVSIGLVEARTAVLVSYFNPELISAYPDAMVRSAGIWGSVTSEQRQRVWGIKEERTPRSTYGHLNKQTRQRATFFYTALKLLILLGEMCKTPDLNSGNL